MIKTYYKGDDIVINMKIKDSTNYYINLNTYKNIHVRVRILGDTLIFKASTDPSLFEEEYATITYLDDYTFQVIIDSSITLNMMAGLATMGVNLVKNTSIVEDTNLNSNIEINKIFKLSDTETKIGEDS